MTSLLYITGLGIIGYLVSKIPNMNTPKSFQLNDTKVEETANFIKETYTEHMESETSNIDTVIPDPTKMVSTAHANPTNNSDNKSCTTFTSPITGVTATFCAEPFYKGKIKQHTDLDKDHINLAWMTGTDKDIRRNKEIIKPLFEPTKNIGNINGVSIYASDLKHRYNTSNYIRGERPFEQIQVGPGLNKGFVSEGSGGFQQSDTRDYIMPKNIDQLRTLNNPKLTYKSRVSAPKQSISSRGKMGLMFKNKVETSFNQSHEDLLVTTGSVIKAPGRSTIIIKNTNRRLSHNIMGNPKYTVDTATVQENYRDSKKLTYCNDQARNLDGGHIGQNEANDYGKKSFFLDINKRNITELRTHTTNVAKAVKAVVTPFTDLFKSTIKETTEVNNNTGNMGKNIFRTSMKDKDNQQLNPTLRETLDNEDSNRNLNGNETSYMRDLDDTLKNTIKQTTENNNHSGHMQSKESANGYLTNVPVAHLTNKEGIHGEYMGTGNSSHQEPMLYNNIMNNKTNGCREETLECREPTTSNVSLTSGLENINMTIGKNDKDYENNREAQHTTMNYIGNNIEQLKNTQTRLKDMPNSARNNINILNQLKNNPFVTGNKF